MSTGAKKDMCDDRDWKISNFVSSSTNIEKIDHSSRMLEVRNQGKEGTCVGFGTCAMKEFFEGFQLSPRFIYELVKEPQGGAYPRNAMKMLMSVGVPDEKCQPYIPNNITPKCKDSMIRASPNKISGYARITTEDEMKRTLIKNGPFGISLKVYDSWYATSNGLVKQFGVENGLHWVAVVGFDESNRTFKFKNSWGSNWGDSGYGYIHYGDISRTMQDAWSIVDIPDNEEYSHIKNTTFIQRLFEWFIRLFDRKS